MSQYLYPMILFKGNKRRVRSRLNGPFYRNMQAYYRSTRVGAFSYRISLYCGSVFDRALHRLALICRKQWFRRSFVHWKFVLVFVWIGTAMPGFGVNWVKRWPFYFPAQWSDYSLHLLAELTPER